MSRNKKYFGTDGIRGIAGEAPLDPETLMRLGKAIGEVFVQREGKKHSIFIGKDTRLSGYMIETSLAAGLTSCGADVLLSGPIPTPAVAYLTRSMRADAGIMISASHNPFEDNGIKLFASDGFKLPDETEFQLEALLDNPELGTKCAKPGEIGKARRIDDAIGRYTVYLKNCFPREISLEGMKLGFDCANGAAHRVGPLAFEELGAEVISRGTTPNGKNINAGFGSLYPEIVRKLVLEQNLNLGISLDGDADRAIFVDEKGSVVDGDMVLAVCAISLKERGLLYKNKVVATVMSNLGLEKLLKKHDISVVRTQVGDRNVLEEMKREGLVLGGEQSGHTIFLEHSTTGDGLLTALKVLEAMMLSGKPLSELTADFVRFPQKLINVKVAAKPELDSVEEIRQVIEQKEKELKDQGRILVRYSGTENKARVMVECEDQDECCKHAKDVAETIEKAIGSM